MCMVVLLTYMSVYYMNACCPKGQKRMPDKLELVLQTRMSCMWILGIELRSSGKALVFFTGC